MSVHEVRLVKKETVAKDTMAFFFEKPNGFKFKPGQYCDFILINPSETDSEGNVRSFTLASAPFENTLRIATRMRDTAFKRVLKDMEIGSVIKLDGPNGKLTLKQGSQPAIFITGGIGVTPVRSIVSQATHDKLNQQMYLFYSNKTVDSAVFLNDFFEYTKKNDCFHFIPTITGPIEKLGGAEIGRVNSDMIERYITDSTKPNYYVTGPKSMVVSIRKMLIESGINKHSILIEEFLGY